MASRATTAALGAVLALALAGCSGAASGSSSSGPGQSEVTVVATTSIWGDITGQVVECAGSGEVTTLMPVGTDPHDYVPSSQDMVRIESADLVIANGLGLEEGLAHSLEAAERDGATVLEVAPLLDPLPFGNGTSPAQASQQGTGPTDGPTDATADPTHDPGALDPHVWQEVARVSRAAALIGDRLTSETGEAGFAECGSQLAAELTTLDGQVAATLAKVPPDRRILVTDHDALGYLAAAYGYTVAGTVVPGGSTLAEPSSAGLAALAGTVRETGVPAIFANPANPQVLVAALASEVGDIEVVELYVDGLGEPGSGADTYQGLMTTNAGRIADALAG